MYIFMYTVLEACARSARMPSSTLRDGFHLRPIAFKLAQVGPGEESPLCFSLRKAVESLLQGNCSILVVLDYRDGVSWGQTAPL